MQGGKLLGVQKAQHSPIMDHRREHTIARLWNITETLNVLYRENWTLMANTEMIKFQNEMIQAIKQDMVATEHVCNYSKDQEDTEFTITAAFIYCLSLITTIGLYSISTMLLLFLKTYFSNSFSPSPLTPPPYPP